MRRLIRPLLGLALIAVMVALPSISASAADECTNRDRLNGTCAAAHLTEEAAIIEATQPGATQPGAAPGTTPTLPGGTVGPPAPPPCNPNTPGCDEWGVIMLTPTLSDIAAFRPTPNVDHMEPNGWFVVGLDANFYATGGASVVDGTLLGQPASVRFTPIRWNWQYGDGSSATRSTRGGKWAALGIREFDPTPTSHVYERAGTYYIDLTVGYRAEYTFNGGSWGTIPGTLWLPANRLVATVGGAKTVLVERDCTTSPGGPGC